MKARVERFFTDKLAGRIELRATRYHNAPDNVGRGYITIDGAEFWSMDTYMFWRAERQKIDDIVKMTGLAPAEAQQLAWIELDNEGILSQSSYYQSLETYCNLTIEEALEANDALIRALAMIDKRLGKHRLQVLDVSGEHPMVRHFFELRCEVEGLRRMQAVEGS